MMRLRYLSPLLVLAALHAPVALSQCAEPSALDQDPGAEPLRVEKAAGGDLRVSWESVMADGYRVHRGRLSQLFLNSSYDHRVIAEPTEPELVLEEGEPTWYFLVASDCRADDSGVGRRSDDIERPFGGLISVRVGLQGGSDIAGTQFVLTHSATESFTDDDGVSFIGPYGESGVLSVSNTSEPGWVRCVAARLMGFDPPVDPPEDVTEILFGYHGVPPDSGSFVLESCSSTDSLGNTASEVICSISGYDILF